MCDATEGRLGFVPNLGSQARLRQGVVRMGASRERTNATI
jgi:hypothetical protein